MVFRVESREHPAGDNDSIYATGEFRLREDNPHNDFVAEQRSLPSHRDHEIAIVSGMPRISSK
jgi:hypothetical protein